MIKAIETVYNRYKFRSRLEARWAIFLDTVGIKYEYELEGFDLGEAGYYLPDFFLPEYDWFMEVKGKQPNEKDKAKINAFDTHSMDYGAWGLIVVIGTPEMPEFSFDEGVSWKGNTSFLCICTELYDRDLLRTGVTAARQARFERGAR